MGKLALSFWLKLFGFGTHPVSIRLPGNTLVKARHSLGVRFFLPRRPMLATSLRNVLLCGSSALLHRDAHSCRAIQGDAHWFRATPPHRHPPVPPDGRSANGAPCWAERPVVPSPVPPLRHSSAGQRPPPLRRFAERALRRSSRSPPKPISTIAPHHPLLRLKRSWTAQRPGAVLATRVSSPDPHNSSSTLFYRLASRALRWPPPLSPISVRA